MDTSKKQNGFQNGHNLPQLVSNPTPSIYLDGSYVLLDWKKQTELAWAAGFYDGEGYCGIHKISGKKNAMRLNCTIAQVELQPLQRFQTAVGGTINGPYAHKNNENGRKYFQWTSGNTYKITASIFDKLRPFLSEPKTEQFLATLKEYEKYQLETPYTKITSVCGEAGPKYIYEK